MFSPGIGGGGRGGGIGAAREACFGAARFRLGLGGSPLGIGGGSVVGTPDLSGVCKDLLDERKIKEMLFSKKKEE